VKDKSRVGVCMDTCHVFAAGYDVSTATGFDAVLREFDRVVGLKYLRAVHLNGSKTPFGSKRDRHENLGKGFLGLDCFRFIMNDDRFNDIPLVLGEAAFVASRHSTAVPNKGRELAGLSKYRNTGTKR